VSAVYSSSWEPIPEPCYMGSHSDTWNPSSKCDNATMPWNALNPARQVNTRIHLPQRYTRLSWPGWLVIYRDGLLVCGRHPSR